MVKKKKKVFTKLERFLYKSFVTLTVVLILFIVVGQISLA